MKGVLMLVTVLLLEVRPQVGIGCENPHFIQRHQVVIRKFRKVPRISGNEVRKDRPADTEHLGGYSEEITRLVADVAAWGIYFVDRVHGEVSVTSDFGLL